MLAPTLPPQRFADGSDSYHGPLISTSPIVRHDQHQCRPPDLKLRFVLYLNGLGDPLAINQCAVRRFEIFHGDDGVSHFDYGMLTRGLAVIDRQIGAGPSDRDSWLFHAVHHPGVRARDDGDGDAPAGWPRSEERRVG